MAVGLYCLVMGMIKVKKKPGQPPQKRASPRYKARGQTALLEMDGTPIDPTVPIKSPQGSPSIVPTKEIVDTIVQNLEDGNYKNTACLAAGIHPDLLTLWFRKGSARKVQCCKTDKDREAIAPFVELRKRVGMALAMAESKQLGVLNKAASDGEWRAAAFIMERRWPENWARTTEVKVRGTVNHDHTLVQKALADPASATKVIDLYEEATESTDDEPDGDSPSNI